MKRKAEHVELEASASAEVSRLFSECKTWKDRCGQPFRLVNRIECFTDKAVVTIAAFDRLACSSIVKACTQPKKTPHRASDACTNSEERSVSFTITRAAAHVDEAGKQSAALSNDLAFERFSSSQVTFEPPGCIFRADESECISAARTLNGVLSRVGPVKVKCFPSNYELCATSKTCTLRACTVLMKWPGSYVDFESGTVCVVIDRKTPDL